MLASRLSFRVLLLIAGMAALAACASATQSVVAAEESDAGPLAEVDDEPVTDEAAGGTSAVSEIEHRVIADDVDSFVDAESFTVLLATNSEELEGVMASIGLPTPEIDFDQEVVLNFNIAESSSCRFLPVEGLLFDEESRRLYPNVQLDLPVPEVEGEGVVCTDDDTPHGIVLAVPRDALPEGDFNIWVELRDPPGRCTENLLSIEAGALARPSNNAAPSQTTTTTTAMPQAEDIEAQLVPDLSGMLIDDAVSLVGDLGLVAEIVIVDEPPATPEHVIRTDPPAGTEVEFASTVILSMQIALHEPEDPQGAALIELQNLIDSEPELFVGYYLDEAGAAIVATSPNEDEAQELLTALGQNYETVACSRSGTELMEIGAQIRDQVQSMGLDSGFAFGIDAQTCTVKLRASLDTQQEDQLLELFGDAITVDPNVSFSTFPLEPDTEQ